MSDDDDFLVSHILTEDEVLVTGLLFADFDEQQIHRCSDRTNRTRFNSKYGASPTVICTLYEDLQKSSAVDRSVVPHRIMRLEGSPENFKWLLRSMMYVKKYPLEDEFEIYFHLTARYAPGQISNVTEKNQYLKYLKVTWPDDFAFADIWIMSINGTHIWIEEPSHEIYSMDTDYFSHKFNKAGINYKLGIALASGWLLWMNGPFKAGQNYLSIFVQEGLEQRLIHLGKKAIGDSAYKGHEEAVCYPNVCDSDAVRKFKSRALKRHEDFNGMTKTFKILRNCFRHGVGKIAAAFESVAVICQYKIETDDPLYDILIESVVYGNGDQERVPVED